MPLAWATSNPRTGAWLALWQELDGCPPLGALRENLSLEEDTPDSLKGHAERSRAVRAIMLASEGLHAVVGPPDDPRELAINLLEFPVLAPLVLDPLEVGYDYTAGVTEDVWDYLDSPALEDLVRLRRRRAVGGLGDDLGLDPMRVVTPDLILESGRYEDIGLDGEDLI